MSHWQVYEVSEKSCTLHAKEGVLHRSLFSVQVWGSACFTSTVMLTKRQLNVPSPAGKKKKYFQTIPSKHNIFLHTLHGLLIIAQDRRNSKKKFPVPVQKS